MPQYLKFVLSSVVKIINHVNYLHNTWAFRFKDIFQNLPPKICGWITPTSRKCGGYQEYELWNLQFILWLWSIHSKCKLKMNFWWVKWLNPKLLETKFSNLSANMRRKMIWNGEVGGGDICNDGAAAVIGKWRETCLGNASSSHCDIRWPSSATKKLPQDLKLVLDDSVKIINQINSRPLQAHLLKLTAEDLCMRYFHLLLHIKEWRLSTEKILARLFKLKYELLATFMEELFIHHLTDLYWLIKLILLSLKN